MKKILLACLFMFSCTLIPVSADSKTSVPGTKTIEYTDDGTPIINLDEMVPSKNIDLGNVVELDHSSQPFAYGDIIYENYYVTAYARSSLNIGYFVFGYTGDRILIEWDGATELNPNIDVVIKLADGTLFSIYDNYGDMIDKNAGAIYIESKKASSVNIYFTSYNYNNVVFYRITSKDGAR